MKSYSLIIVFFAISLFQASSQAPDWVWARSARSPGTGEGLNIATDNWDNVFITGWFQDSITFASYVLTGANSVFLAKYDSYGNVKWAKTASGGTSVGTCVAADVFGNSYVTGYFANSISFGSHTITTVGSYNIFLVKYDSSGNVLWARSAGGLQSDNAWGVTTDASGNVYVTGTFSSYSFTIGSFTLINSGSANIFLAKYDSTGNVLWAKSAVGAGGDRGYSAAADTSGNVFLTGHFTSSSLTFGVYTLTNAGSDDIFLVKYDSSGNVLWAKSVGGTSADYGYHVATDASNNAYLTGYYSSSSITFGTYTLTNAGNSDAFLVKYNSSGNVSWAKNIGSTGLEYGWCVATDRFNKIFVTGAFRFTTLTFGAITLPYPTGALDAMFIAGYDSTGQALFAKALGSGGDDNNAVAASPSGCIYIGGDFELPSLVVGNDTLIRTGTNDENVFVAKICYSGLIASFNCSDTAFCNESGQCINFFDHSTGNPTSWQWQFTGANPSSSNLQNPTNICYTTPGTYPVTLIVSNGTITDTLNVSPLIIYGTTPPPPTITVKGGDTLVSSHGSSYQWYLNGSPITGATDSFYVAHQGGTYAVQITDSTGGCNSISNGLAMGLKELTGNGDITIYPNPASQSVVISWQSAISGNVEISVVNVLGEKVYSQQLQTFPNGSGQANSKPQTINCKSFAAGIYFVKVSDEKTNWIGKFVKE